MWIACFEAMFCFESEKNDFVKIYLAIWKNAVMVQISWCFHSRWTLLPIIGANCSSSHLISHYCPLILIDKANKQNKTKVQWLKQAKKTRFDGEETRWPIGHTVLRKKNFKVRLPEPYSHATAFCIETGDLYSIHKWNNIGTLAEDMKF